VKINVHQVLADSEARKKEAPPMPKVIIRKVFAATGKKETTPEAKKQSGEAPSPKTGDTKKDLIMRELWEQMSALKTERGVLSTRTAYLVTEVANKLLQHDCAKANAFMNGELAMPEIAEHYEKIQAITKQATAVYDKIEYVDKYGKLPEDPNSKPVLDEESPEVSSITYQIRRLDDFIYKTEKKVKGPPPKNPSRLTMWKLSIDKAIAERRMLKTKREDLQDAARRQRAQLPGAE
jgi:hypothetical protein